MIAAAERAGVILQVGFMLRFTPPVPRCQGTAAEWCAGRCDHDPGGHLWLGSRPTTGSTSRRRVAASSSTR